MAKTDWLIVSEGSTVSFGRLPDLVVFVTENFSLFSGFRLSNLRILSVIDSWKKVQHSNIVQIREVFTTKLFGDSCKWPTRTVREPKVCWKWWFSFKKFDKNEQFEKKGKIVGFFRLALVFVYDYYPGAETLKQRHFGGGGSPRPNGLRPSTLFDDADVQRSRGGLVKRA